MESLSSVHFGNVQLFTEGETGRECIGFGYESLIVTGKLS